MTRGSASTAAGAPNEASTAADSEGADSAREQLDRTRCCAVEMEDEVGQASVGGNGGGAAGDGRGAGGVTLLASARPKLEQEEREGNGIGAEDG